MTKDVYTHVSFISAEHTSAYFPHRHYQQFSQFSYRAIKQVGHDFDENKEEAQAVIGAYAFVKRKLAERGVEV